MAQSLLSSKIVINEEPPQIRSITAQPTAVLGMVGITERGPVGQPVLSTSFEEWRNVFGSFTVNSRDAIAAVSGFFEEGGQFLWFSRVVHMTDVTDADTATSAAGTVTLQTGAIVAAVASVTATNVAPYALTAGATLLLSEDGGGDETVTIDAGAATVTGSNTENFGLSDGQTLLVSVNNGPVQTVTFATADFAAIGAATAAEVAAVADAAIIGVTADVDTAAVRLTSDGQGSGFTIEVTGGTAAATLGFALATATGTGDAANIAAVSVAELAVVIAADTTNLVGTTVDNRLVISTADTGVAATLAVSGGTAAATIGFDTSTATGVDAAAALDTLRIDARSHGSYSDEVTVTVSAATSGAADQFNLLVLRNGVVDEVYANLSMDDTAANYVESAVNADIPAGSLLILATDLDAGSATASALLQRPADQVGTALAGGSDGLVGLADSDFTGDEGEKTGLYALDGDSSQPITLLAAPGRPTATVHNALLNYAESHRAGSVFAILDSPAGLTAQGILNYVRNEALLEGASESGGIFYPLVRVINPNTTVFGDEAFIEVFPCGHIAGVMSNTDNSQPGGIYNAPAGQENGRLRSIIGFEILPGRQQPETFDETKRDLIYPARINPLDANGGLRIIDGARTLRSDGNFPFINERRGASFIETTIKSNLEFARFRNNDDTLRAEVARIIEKFLLDQMSVGAFRTRDPKTAFFVDVGRGLNPDSVILRRSARRAHRSRYEQAC